MLIEVKATLRQGDRLVSLKFMSNGTHLSNFAGNKKVWPVYMTIGHQSLKIRLMPSMHTIVMVALLPIPIMNHNIPPKGLDEQRQRNRGVLDKALRRVLQPRTIEQNPDAESGYYNILRADGNCSHCKLILAAWMADSPEYSNRHHLERHVCFSFECPKNALGDYVPPDEQHPWRDHNLYRTLTDANTEAADAEFSSRHVHRE